MLTKREVLLIVATFSVTYVIQEYRAFKFLKEADTRFQDQQIRLSSMAEQIEMLQENT